MTPKTSPLAGALALGLLAVAPAAASERVRASWYGGSGERLHAHAADGSRFNPRAMTGAHRTLPFGTRLRVCRANACVVVRVNDRGPARWTGRALDLSRGAADVLGLTRAGVGSVSLERL
jgi:rare lipoprotein A